MARPLVVVVVVVAAVKAPGRRAGVVARPLVVVVVAPAVKAPAAAMRAR